MADDLNPKFGLDVTDFVTGIKEINRKIRLVESGFRASAAELDNWEKSADGLEQRIKTLNSKIDLQKEKVIAIQGEHDKVAQEKGRASRAAEDLEIKLNRETETLNKMKNELDESKKSLEKVTDESGDASGAMDTLGDEADEARDKMGKMSKVASGLKDALKVGAGAIAGLTGIVAGAAVAMGKTVVESFGELEQNLGGSEAVFGKYADSIQKTGEDAYKNLGVSQSDYLATANKMGALFQGSGLDQVTSLELTEKAMQRAADMASVMGIDMQVALDSVAGAAKGNFTMMDNLGVAMNATNVEAYALSKGLDFAWDSATNAEKAEVAMQMFFENTEQYAGNFAKEASETITGSIGMFKAAFGSFMAGLGNEDADVGNLTDNLVDAFKSVLDNIVPVLENIVAALPTATAALLAAVSDMLPLLVETATTLFTQVLDTVVGLLPTLIPVAVDALMTIVNAIIQNLPMLMDAGIQLLLALIDGILPQLPLLIDMALKMIVTLANGIAEALPELMPMIAEIIPQIILTLIDNLPLLIDAALQLIIALVEGLAVALPILVEYIPEIIQAIFDALILALPLIADAAVELVMALIDGIGNLLPSVGKAAGGIVEKLVQGIKDLIPKIIEVGGNIVSGIWQGIKDRATWFREQVNGFFSGIVGGVKKALGIQSPSKVFAGIGENLALGLGSGFTSAIDGVKSDIDHVVNGMKNVDLNGSFSGQAAGMLQPAPVYVTVQANVAQGVDYYRLAHRIGEELSRRRR